MNDLKRYYRQVASWLPCGGKTKRDMMARIRATVDAYIAEHPAADLAAIQARFGTPQQIAAAFVDEMETEELLQRINYRNKIIKGFAILAATIILLWTLTVTIALLDSINSSGGHLVDEIIVTSEEQK